MKFCPLLSTADKKVECQSDCEWLTHLKDGSTQCAVNYIYNRCDNLDLIHTRGGIVNEIANNM